MKIYILSAVILFCNTALAMDESKKNTIISQGDPFVVVVEASGYRPTIDKPGSVAIVTQNVVNTYNTTQSRNRPCTVRRLLSPCRYLSNRDDRKYNPFPSKL